MNLQTFFSENPCAAVAFSGGTDSSYLLYAAKQASCNIRAYFIKSSFQPRFELDDAIHLAQELAIPFTVAEYEILQNSLVAENGPRRCYHCKTALFSRLRELAAADGYPFLWDGTNASDNTDDRPGMRALLELGVRSPLRECGLTKVEIRQLSKEAGLFTHDKPAYACLATRIPTGTQITVDLLEKAERAEATLFSLGFTDLRVRVVGDTAKIQLPAAQMGNALVKRKDITAALRPDFEAVTLDLEPR